METVAQQRAGAQRSGTSPLYEVLAEDTVAMGVEAAFGLISDDTALLATALDTSGARFSPLRAGASLDSLSAARRTNPAADRNLKR
jgi:hypothetical protein